MDESERNCQKVIRGLLEPHGAETLRSWESVYLSLNLVFYRRRPDVLGATWIGDGSMRSLLYNTGGSCRGNYPVLWGAYHSPSQQIWMWVNTHTQAGQSCSRGRAVDASESRSKRKFKKKNNKTHHEKNLLHVLLIQAQLVGLHHNTGVFRMTPVQHHFALH